MRTLWPRLRAALGRILGLTQRAAMDRRLEEELAFHVDMEARRLIALGLAPEEARRRAAIALGGRQVHIEAARDAYRSRVLDDLGRDIRHGARALRRAPAFSLAVIGSLAVGIGAMSAAFTVTERVILRPLPYGAGGKLVMLWSQNRRTRQRDVISYPDFLDWTGASRSVARAAAFNVWLPALTEPGAPSEGLAGATVGTDFFRVLGVAPALGRDFRPDENQFAPGPVVILAHSLWKRRFHADPGIIGRAITLSSGSFTVVGVMPEEFRHPELLLHKQVEIWRPYAFDATATARQNHFLRGVARLAPGVSTAQVQHEMDAIAARLRLEYPADDGGKDVAVVAIEDQIVGPTRPVLWAALGAAVCLLLIVCGNVATLVLARHAGRAPELAVRRALGAGRARVARMLFVESALLGVVGGAVGIGLAWVATSLLRAAAPRDLPRVDEIVVDGWVVVVTVMVTLAAAILFGLVPALRASRRPPGDLLPRATGRLTTHHRLRSAVIVAELALSLALVATAGLLGRTLLRLGAVRLGFRTDHLLTMQVSLPGRRYGADSTRTRLYAQLTHGLEQLPGVESAGITSSLPLSGLNDISFMIPVTPNAVRDRARWRDAGFRFVSPGYRGTIGLRLVAGRDFEPGDSAGSAGVVLLSARAALAFFPGENPVGRTLVVDPDSVQGVRVAGVVDDARDGGPMTDPIPTFYVPLAQGSWGNAAVVVRTTDAPMGHERDVRSVLASLDPSIVATDLQPLSTLESALTARQRFYGLLFAAFAAVAVLLSALGIYGVVAYVVTQQRREIGLRIALGADPWRVLGPLLGRVATLTALGIACGLLGAAAVTRVLSGLLYGVRADDPATFGIAVSVLALVALAAGVPPALRAARTPPAAALRVE